MLRRKAVLYFPCSAGSRARTTRREALVVLFLIGLKKTSAELFPDRFLKSGVVANIRYPGIPRRFDQAISELGVLLFINPDNIKRHGLVVSLQAEVVCCLRSEEV